MRASFLVSWQGPPVHSTLCFPFSFFLLLLCSPDILTVVRFARALPLHATLRGSLVAGLLRSGRVSPRALSGLLRTVEWVGVPPPPPSPSSPCHRSVVASFFLLSSRAELGQNGRNGSRAADCFALCRDRTTGQGHGARAQTAGSSDCCVRSACSTHRGDHGPQARVFGCKLVPEGYVENHYGQGPWASPRHEGETRLHPL